MYSFALFSLRKVDASPLHDAQRLLVMAVVLPDVFSRNFSNAGAFFDGVAIWFYVYGFMLFTNYRPAMSGGC